MEREKLRQMVIIKVADELYVEHEFVDRVLKQIEAEQGEQLYGHDTIAELVARVLDIMDQHDW